MDCDLINKRDKNDKQVNESKESEQNKKEHLKKPKAKAGADRLSGFFKSFKLTPINMTINNEIKF